MIPGLPPGMMDKVVGVIPGERSAEGEVTAPLIIMESGLTWWRVEARPGRPSSEVEWISGGPPVPGTLSEKLYTRPRQ